MSKQIKPWMEVTSLHPDVLSEHFSEDIFALDLGPLSDGSKSVAAVYRDPEHFFRTSYLTSGLKGLLQDVLSRLNEGAGNRVIKLMTPFGGGKSHTMAALFHAARDQKALDVIPEGQDLPRPGKVNVCVFDGLSYDPLKGKEMSHTGQYARTLWGWMAWSLGGTKGYEILHEQDQARVAPGSDEILKAIQSGPNLILLDEILAYLINVGGVKVHKTQLRDETIIFLQRLTVAVNKIKDTVLVFSLPSSRRESLDHIGLLEKINHITARKDEHREPVKGDEILSVIQRRLVEKAPDEEDASAVAHKFQEGFTRMRRAYAQNGAEEERADDEGLVFRDRVKISYPFHPALIDLMRERWAAIPNFQHTRGALRFLAACLRASHQEGKRNSFLMGPGDVPIHDAKVRLAFFKEVGQESEFQAVLESDFIGANARVRRIDKRRAKESPTEASMNHASRLATAILMYSFGGLRRETKAGALPPGITESELLSVCISPDLDSTTAQACLKELQEQCLYLHFDGARYCFKKDPNITLIIEQEAESVSKKRVQMKIRGLLEERLAGYHDAIVWPDKSGDISNTDPRFLIAYLPLEFGNTTEEKQEEKAKELFENYGDKPRQYRNGLGLAVPSKDQIETLRRSVQYLLAVEQVKSKGRSLNLTDEQKSQLREKETTEKSVMEAAFLHLYASMWLPVLKSGNIMIHKISSGGRPLNTTLDEKKRAAVHGRVIELLEMVHRCVFRKIVPTKIMGLFNMGAETDQKPGVRLSEVVESFFSILDFPTIMNEDVIRDAIVRGVQEGVMGYISGSADPALGNDDKFQVPPDAVYFETSVPNDEIDLETGFIMIPSAIPQKEEPAQEIPSEPSPTPVNEPPTPPTPPIPSTESERDLQISFSVGGDKVYKAWKAVANLAEFSDNLDITIHATSKKGFDKNKIKNGVMEPLREADLIK